MKIAFIRPSMFGKQSKDAMYPLVFAIVKSLTPDMKNKSKRIVKTILILFFMMSGLKKFPTCLMLML